MDPLTQGVFGSLFAQAGARRSDIRPAAMVGLVSGMAADLDVLIRSSSDALLTIEYHRHFTHSLASVPALALAVSLLAWPLVHRWRPGIGFARVFLWSALGVLSHGLLDAMTSYGTRLFWPLSETRVALGVISVIDPLFTLPLMVLMAFAVWKGLRRWAGLALAWALIYLSLGFVQQQRAEQILMEWAENSEIDSERVLVKPSFANLVLWRGLIDDGARLHSVAVRILPGTQPLIWQGATVDRFVPPVLGGNTRVAEDLKRFQHFSDGWMFAFPALDRGSERFIGDFRYAVDPASARPLWGVVFDPDQLDRGVRFDRPVQMPESERRAFMARLLGEDP
ncbi:MAG: metal-dependent hydrolase [Xanthomonadaceae bacterium]|nr:metal-dependent hydrolase [Xanthomonadaceae bacterium]